MKLTSASTKGSQSHLVQIGLRLSAFGADLVQIANFVPHSDTFSTVQYIVSR